MASFEFDPAIDNNDTPLARRPWSNKIYPGNYVAQLNAYRDQGVVALPGAVFFRATFGQFNFSTMVETSVISLVAHATEDESMLGYISVTDSPLIGKEGDAFDRYIKSLQSFMPDANNINTLFINFLFPK